MILDSVLDARPVPRRNARFRKGMLYTRIEEVVTMNCNVLEHKKIPFPSVQSGVLRRPYPRCDA